MTDEARKALADCPFCGGKAALVLGMKQTIRTVVVCQYCGGSMPAFCEEDAIGDWNARSQPGTLAREEELERVLRECARLIDSGGDPTALSRDVLTKLIYRTLTPSHEAGTQGLLEATAAQHFDLPKGQPAKFVRNGVLETCQCRECTPKAGTQEPVAWLDIATAPKDGRSIEVKCLTDDPRKVRWSQSAYGTTWHLVETHSAAPLKFEPTHWRSLFAAPQPASVAHDNTREALDLLQLQQRGRAQAFRILDSKREVSDPTTLAMADAYEECGNELNAILASPIRADREGDGVAQASSAPDYEAAARALGFHKVEDGKWWTPEPWQHGMFMARWDTAKDIFDWWGKASGNAQGSTEWVEVTDGTTLPGDRFSYIPNPETGVGQITSHKRRGAQAQGWQDIETAPKDGAYREGEA